MQCEIDLQIHPTVFIRAREVHGVQRERISLLDSSNICVYVLACILAKSVMPSHVVVDVGVVQSICVTNMHADDDDAIQPMNVRASSFQY